MPTSMPVMRPRTVLFFPKNLSCIGHESSRIIGIFFATTGDAFARNAGRNIRKRVKKLAIHIARNQRNKRK